MRCSSFDAGMCRSCAWIERPYPEQLAAKQAHVAGLLADHRALTWLPPVASAEEGYRNKAKMVVGGTVEDPRVGVLDERGHTVDLRDCPLHTPGLRAALAVLAEFVSLARLEPYDIGARRGELKYLLVTQSPDGELMVRFVCRSTEPLARLRKHLPWLLAALPVRVASLNVQPLPAAVLEGDREELLTEQGELGMRLAGLELALRPQSFFQTNTAVAAELYRQARTWVDEADPATVWDLYCGVGGFALACADGTRDVVGIETSREAVASATASARRAGVRGVRFAAGDAAAFARETGRAPDLVIVNPPRRGIGDLADWLEASTVRTVVYSSCNAVSLARDLARMSSLTPVRGRVLDMFPQTAHAETLVLLERR
ncbi:23S rRNA (uracil(747)-C(5))-methyltransferase RlmC [Actinotalea fermentans]|uniref:23S rRNA (Uracil(747)-C(5))-methyltransferase RlmC n=1 Tax=Actinotalea fermentans TaxID=43671 RepID=A0A511YWI1_9CELL|nr:23S rRNA (uracil(747)-C(5))-methyltransferase RlmC [Actinotalea fermentans]KGM16394.1 23S rRNA methyltransferase [Actinotalea fermentans ATCC 43279 = JCM 9966 = DSM 3133]GEN79529.1 23S rRNA (uracil(747)-C(5))-methyltransferase RlmC [Actinotalea fermentans]